MANTWFKMYHEFASDPKVQMLSEIDQRRFVMILCIRCCNGYVMFHDEEVAFQLRISVEEWLKTKAILIDKQMVGEDNKPIHWDQRQTSTNTSTVRVRAHREKKKQDETPCNTSETTVKRTDKDKDKEKEGAKFTPPDFDSVADYCKERGNDVNPRKFVDFYSSKGWMVGKNKRNWEKTSNEVPAVKSRSPDGTCKLCEGLVYSKPECRDKNIKSIACGNYVGGPAL